MTRTERDCRWRLLLAYHAWCLQHLQTGTHEAAVWQLYLALGLRAPLAWTPTVPEAPHG